MKAQQKETHGDIIHIIQNCLKVIKSMNQSDKTRMKNQTNIIKK